VFVNKKGAFAPSRPKGGFLALYASQVPANIKIIYAAITMDGEFHCAALPAAFFSDISLGSISLINFWKVKFSTFNETQQ
jgi:hypothetical protein